MKVTAWNVGPRSNASIVRDLGTIKAAKDDKITALFEASDRELVKQLRDAHPDDRVLWGRSDVVALIPRGTPRPRVEVVGHGVAWTGPHMGKVHHGRRWLLLVWDDEAVLLVHRVPGGPSGGQGGGNRKAWVADLAVIGKVARRTDLPDKLAVIGDHNGTASELRDEYADLGLSLLPVNAHVDQAAVRGFRGGGSRLGNHGSDHVALGWSLR